YHASNVVESANGRTGAGRLWRSRSARWRAGLPPLTQQVGRLATAPTVERLRPVASRHRLLTFQWLPGGVFRVLLVGGDAQSDSPDGLAGTLHARAASHSGRGRRGSGAVDHLPGL